jgi:predicted DNA-binding protein with PD1-like motif
MSKIKRLGCALVLIGITAVMVRSQGTAGEYVKPAEAVPTGKAPKMLVQLLNPGEPTKQYAIIFYQGDEVYSGLQEFAEKYHVTSAHFTAIGALDDATVGWFDPQRKMYKKIAINGQHELIGMSPDGTTRAGHVLEAYASPTVEAMVTVDPVTMQKRFDPTTDLTLIDPALK